MARERKYPLSESGVYKVCDSEVFWCYPYIQEFLYFYISFIYSLKIL